MLATNLDAPEVSETTVGSHVLQSLEVLTELGVENVCGNLGVLARSDILLSVEEPLRDLELQRVLDDGDKSLNLIRLELTSSLVEIDFGLLANQVRKPAAATLDGRQGEHHLLASINVGVEDTQNVLEIRACYERHSKRKLVSSLQTLNDSCKNLALFPASSSK